MRLMRCVIFITLIHCVWCLTTSACSLVTLLSTLYVRKETMKLWRHSWSVFRYQTSMLKTRYRAVVKTVFLLDLVAKCMCIYVCNAITNMYFKCLGTTLYASVIGETPGKFPGTFPSHPLGMTPMFHRWIYPWSGRRWMIQNPSPFKQSLHVCDYTLLSLYPLLAHVYWA